MSQFKESKLFHVLNWMAAAVAFTGVASAMGRFYQTESFEIDAPGAISSKREIQAELAEVMGREPPISAFPVQVNGALGGTYNVTQCEATSGERFVIGRLQPGNFLNGIRPTKIIYSTSEYRSEPADPC